MEHQGFRLCLMVVFAGIYAGCPFSSGPPAIKEIRVRGEITVRDSAWFKCEMESPGKGSLVFRWSCSRGRFVDSTTDSAKWFAPESSGSVLIVVKVTDRQGDSAVDSLLILVNPLKRSFINWDGAVKAGNYVFFYDSCWAGYQLSGRSSSDTGDVFLIFLDSLNFHKWRTGEQYQCLIRRPAYNTSSFYDTIPETGIYFLVLDNTRNFRDCSFQVNIQLLSP
ncbi:MAG: hypothetical protein ACUVUR_01590 [bacterium]